VLHSGALFFMPLRFSFGIQSLAKKSNPKSGFRF
jgi:hypothetical protein